MTTNRDERDSPRARPPAPRGERIAEGALGAVSGALVGGLGLLVMGPGAPPAEIMVGVLAALGAVGGYQWGPRIHLALLDAFIQRGAGSL